MKKITNLIAVTVLAVSTAAFALPTLQLDVSPGTYDTGDQTTIADIDTFDLYALLNPDADSGLDGLYRVSVAVTPKVPEADPKPSLGSFTFAGTEYSVTEDMVWGTPPEALLGGTTGVGDDLASHGIFETYFMEFDIVFDSSLQMAKYDVQTGETSPGNMYYQALAVTAGGLDEGYGLHFDLYQVAPTETEGTGKQALTPSTLTSIVEFAPFSHDAGTGTSRNPPTGVPDQTATVGLLGMAMLAIEALRRKIAAK
jgi:hypothetical protein